MNFFVSKFSGTQNSKPETQNCPSRSGQSIIEAMIAIGILTVGFLGLTTLLSKSFFYDRVISDQLTATYLASEGVEIAKNLIDHDVFSGAGWNACFAPYENGNGTADIALDYLTTDCATIVPYSASVPLRFDPATKQYSYLLAGNATNFTRDIRITPNAAGNELTVQSIVNWSTGPVIAQSIDLEDHFYDWRQ